MSTEHTAPSPQDTEPPFIIAGGFGYDERRNRVASDYVRSLGHSALPPLADPSVDATSKEFRVKMADGAEMTVHRRQAYFLAPKPEVTVVSSRYQEQRAEELITHIEQQGSSPVNGIFQSADAQNGLLAAHRRPDLFQNVVFAFPSSFVKKNTSTEYTRQMIRVGKRHRGEKHALAASDDFEAATRPRSLREKRADRTFSKSGGFAVAASVTVAYHNNLLTELRSREDAPGIGLVMGLKDPMMQPERIIESLNSSNDVDCILITNTKHGWNGSKELMDKTLSLFPKMEEITAQRRSGQEVASLRERVIFAEDVPDTDRRRILEMASKLDAKTAA